MLRSLPGARLDSRPETYPRQGDFQMPIVKIHVLAGRYDERRLSNVSKAVQDALISILKIPSDDFFQIIYELPRNRFLHTPSFLGMKYSDDFIVLEVAFISGRPKETPSITCFRLTPEKRFKHLINGLSIRHALATK